MRFYGREDILVDLEGLWGKSVASLVTCRGRRSFADYCRALDTLTFRLRILYNSRCLVCNNLKKV